MARHVGLVLSKILAPLWISLKIVSFHCENACWSLSSQWNVLPGSYVCEALLCGEVGNGSDVSLAWSHSAFGDFKASEFDFTLSKTEHFWC